MLRQSPCLFFLLLPALCFSRPAGSWQEVSPDEPLAHTYSIVAIDQESGEMGVAVQSHWFSVGPVVPWAKSGAGVIATQSLVNLSYGPNGLELLAEGKAASQVVAELTSADEASGYRQLAVIDTKGGVATWTGDSCIPEAGHITGEHYSVQANMMLNATVWGAMSASFESSEGPLAERLLSALEAAENAGGDIRGRQSAAIVVVRIDATDEPWNDKLVDLRVEDSEEPLPELRRLLTVHRAYEHMNEGDLAIERGDDDLALKEYALAEQMNPDNPEMTFWHAVSLANVGRVEGSLPLFAKVFRASENWRELTRRLPAVNLLVVKDEELRRILDAD